MCSVEKYCHPISCWSVEGEVGDRRDTALGVEGEQPKTLLQPTYLALDLFLEGGLTYLPNTTKKKATRNRFQ